MQKNKDKTLSECSMNKVWHEKSAEREKYNMEIMQFEQNETQKSETR